MTAKTKFAISTVVSAVLALGIFLFILLISHQNNHKWDLTLSQRFSLSPQSVQVVRGLQTPVQAVVFLLETDNAGRQKAEDLLGNYKAADPGRFSFRIVDPEKNPTEADKYDVSMTGQCVLVAGAKTQRVGAMGEEELTNALLKLSELANKKVYFLTGHGERVSQGNDPNAVSRFRGALAADGFEGADLSIYQQKSIPADAAVLVMAGPTNEMLPAEQQILKSWLEKGGRLLLTLEKESGDKYDWLLKERFISSPTSVVVDQASALMGTEPVNIVVQQYAMDHAITQDFKQVTTVFPVARLVEPSVDAKDLPKGVSVNSLVYALPSAFAVPAEALQGLLRTGQINREQVLPTRGGRVSLAVAGLYPSTASAAGATPSPAAATPKVGPSPAAATTGEARLVVVGDSDFASNRAFLTGGNKDLALNMLNWLTGSENRITIRPKDEATQPLILSQTQSNQIKILLILAIPLAVLLAGFLTAFRRRG